MCVRLFPNVYSKSNFTKKCVAWNKIENLFILAYIAHSYRQLIYFESLFHFFSTFSNFKYFVFRTHIVYLCTCAILFISATCFPTIPLKYLKNTQLTFNTQKNLETSTHLLSQCSLKF